MGEPHCVTGAAARQAAVTAGRQIWRGGCVSESLDLADPASAGRYPSGHSVAGTMNRRTADELRKRRLLSQPAPSRTFAIPDAVVIQNENVVFLCDRDGLVPHEGEHGLGLYRRDCRFLDGYLLAFAGRTCEALRASAEPGFAGVVVLCNPEFEVDRRVVPRGAVGVRWERTVNHEGPGLEDILRFENFGMVEVALSLELAFRARFDDVFVVRGLIERVPAGTLHPPRFDAGRLLFRYDGADGVSRYVAITVSPAPARVVGGTAHLTLVLAPGERADVHVSIRLAERDAPPAEPIDPARIDAVEARVEAECLSHNTSLDSDSVLLEARPGSKSTSWRLRPHPAHARSGRRERGPSVTRPSSGGRYQHSHVIPMWSESSDCAPYSRTALRRSEFPTTESELRAIAALAITGLRSHPVNG